MKRRMSTKTLVFGAILTALVIVLQYVSMAIRFGTFSITLSLTPIVVGAVCCGVGMGAWLGLVFGIAVLMTGDAAPFLAVSIVGTVITVLAKGVAAGVIPALAYKLLRKNKTFASAIAAVLSPVANTGVFLIGCMIFFVPTILGWHGSIAAFLISIFSINFLIELVLNIALIPVVVRIINIKLKNNI